MKNIKILSKHWIVDENSNIIMGAGRKDILEIIDRTGSINQTAKIMKMSYKGVWGRIKATEKALNMKIVNADRKTGSCLTEEGKDLLNKYKQLKKECIDADDRIFMSVFEK